jgi:hypothetical protein
MRSQSCDSGGAGNPAYLISEIVEDLQSELAGQGLWEDPAHPASSAICRALVENFKTALLSAVEGQELAQREGDVSDATLKEVARLFDKALMCLERTQELSKWLPRTVTWSLDDAMQWARTQSKNIPEAAKIMSRLARRNVGRPNKYPMYLAVFELMLQGPAISFGVARKKVQPPISQENEPGLRAGVRKVKELLRTYAPELVSQFEALHPNRAKKVNG